VLEKRRHQVEPERKKTARGSRRTKAEKEETKLSQKNKR
jgi:hypothetical protein